MNLEEIDYELSMINGEIQNLTKCQELMVQHLASISVSLRRLVAYKASDINADCDGTTFNDEYETLEKLTEYEVKSKW